MDKDLFKPFTSYKKKFIPQLTDDWIISGSWRRDYFLFYSPSLGQEIDIEISKTFTFLKKHNYSIQGDKLLANITFSNYGDLYTAEEFMQWEDINEIDTLSEIKKNDLMIGQGYRISDDNTCIYLGFKYVSKIKGKLFFPLLENISKMKKTHYIYSNKYKSILELKDKIIDTTDKMISFDIAESRLKEYYLTSMNIVAFEDINYKEPLYEVVKIKEEDLRKRALLFEGGRNKYYLKSDSFFSMFTKSDFISDRGTIIGYNIENKTDEKHRIILSGLDIKTINFARVGIKK